MRSGRLSAALAIVAIASAVATVPSSQSAGFTRGSHTTRRRINPVTPMPKNPDPAIARWNDAVDHRKAERKSRRGR